MTEEELDLLASAYVDGEATPEEVRLVDGDPALQQRVASMRSVSNRFSMTTPVSSEVKERHIGAALAAFSEIAGDKPKLASVPTAQAASPTDQDLVVDENTIDLNRDDQAVEADNVIRLGERSGRGGTTRAIQTRSPNRMPNWLATAAAAFVVVGGGLWMVSQGNSASQSSDMAAVAADGAESDDAGVTSTTALFEGEEASMAESGEVQGGVDDATASADEAGDTSAQQAPETPDETLSADSRTQDNSSNAGEGGFFPTDPVQGYETVPDLELLAEDPPWTLRRDVSRSNCRDELQSAGDVESFVGYVPLEVAGAPVEFFVVLDEAGERLGVLVDDSCNRLTP